MTVPARPELTRGELLAATLERQHLLRRDASCAQVASDLLGLQAQFSTGPRDEARAELVRRYFEHYGPATVQDCAAFLGYRASEVTALVRRAALPLRELACRGATLSYLGELPSPSEARVPGCVLLAPFDQLVLGYRDRSRLIDVPDLPRVTNRAGIVFATVLYRGRARARWKREGRRVTVTEFRPLSDTAHATIAARVRRFFSPERVEVRFRGEKDVPAPASL